MHLNDVINLARRGESQAVKFKKSTAEKDRACRTLCAFANGQGGRLFFGITPAGRPVGHTANGPVSFRGVPYERVLNTTRVMPRANYQRLLVEALHASDRWELQPATGWTIDMLDTNEITLTIEEAIRRGRINDPGTREPSAVLRGLGLLTSTGQLTRGAIALFCNSDVPSMEFPQFKLRVARFKGTTRSEFLDNRQYYGNAFDLMRRAERFLIDWLPVASRIIPGKMEREDTPTLPVEAVREALANAFVHRDYANFSGSVGVALYDDRLEIISPGELHFGLTPQMLTEPHDSMPWNPNIANTFYRRGHIETWGRGTIKIAELLQQANREPLIVTSSTGNVMVTLRLPPRDGAASGAANEGVNTVAALLLQYIVEHPGQRTQALADAMARPRRTFQRVLKQLQDANLIEFIGPTKSGGNYHKAPSTQPGQRGQPDKPDKPS